MTPCPSCGHVNAGDADTCALCGRALSPTASAQPVTPPGGEPPVAQLHLQPPPGFNTPEGAPPPPMLPPPPMPMPSPVPLFPQQSTGQKVGMFFLGIAIGLIAAVVSVYSFSALASVPNGGGNLALLGCLPGLAAFVGMIVCLSITRLRFIGYGLLAVIVGAPVIFFIGCIVILTGGSLLHR